jgi:hypothetical protein
MKSFMWFTIELCVAIVLASIMSLLVYGVSEHFERFFRGMLACAGAYWFVGKLKENGE